MRTEQPPFLTALGLSHDADERAVKRAYAQRLKRIDQANVPEGFQALRTDYDNALRWVAWQARVRSQQAAQEEEDANEPDGSRAPDSPLAGAGAGVPAQPADVAGTAASQAQTAQPPSPELVGDEVFKAFLEVAHAGTGFGDEAQAQQQLERALADDRLINLDVYPAESVDEFLKALHVDQYIELNGNPGDPLDRCSHCLDSGIGCCAGFRLGE